MHSIVLVGQRILLVEMQLEGSRKDFSMNSQLVRTDKAKRVLWYICTGLAGDAPLSKDKGGGKGEARWSGL